MVFLPQFFLGFCQVDRYFAICYNMGIVSKKEPAVNNWTDKIIHWNQLPGTEVKRLIDTWGMTPEQIAKYDRKHGFAAVQPKVAAAQKPVPKVEAKPKAKPKAKAAPKVSARQRHHGADGEIRFLEHRNLWIGFAGGRVVVTKRTRAACEIVLAENFGIKIDQ